ncbi:MAG TPA: NAD(P)H-dependent oxidoreductase [Dinghuibacter sp.]|jgi:NAD(P)H-dependent FMN reductase|uniref:NADPH-dependent FMN reductase n=1 Tax=Dinghuibacter sp. TaxID=2024697 RepID=UPI002C0B0ED0|nr:NAD(P)H-dependent oxidoreductase [Dinghuibacter sp.]HTJ12937.1 NAD(P)H-dependent oxidoreductase [Dinghuibacter sp.]
MLYTIISGTNRKDSNTLKIAEVYQELLKEQGIEALLLSLVGLNTLERTAELKDVEKKYLVPASKFVFVVPEYNGSYPGVLKALMDNSDIEKAWWGKKALLTGVSVGRAGNLRGLEHLTGVLHYLKMTVYHDKLPISVVNRLLDEQGKLTDPATLKVVRKQLDDFIAF